MRKNNWRFEALARGRIARQEEEARIQGNTPSIEDFKPAEEIERLQNINAKLVETSRLVMVTGQACFADLLKLGHIQPKSGSAYRQAKLKVEQLTQNRREG